MKDFLKGLKNKVIVAIVPTERDAIKMCQEGEFKHFPSPDVLPFEDFPVSFDVRKKRIEILWKLLKGEKISIVTTLYSLTRKTISPKDLTSHTLQLKRWMRIEKPAYFLLRMGYERTYIVREGGEYAIRGEIVDVFPPLYKNPVRLDLFENEIEDIRFFDPISQKTIKKVDEVIILPAREYISENHDADTIPGKYNADSSLLEYLKDPVVIFINKEEVFKEYAKIEKEMKEILGSRYEEYKKLSSIPLSSFEKLFETAKEIEYSFDTKEFHVISPKKKGKTIPILDIEDIKVGDLVVHKDHGIGIFQGVEKVENALGIREYFKIKYADANLYVPVERLDRVHKYIGNSSEISINKLNDKRWKKTVKKIKEDIERKIKELIELYLKRQEVKGLSLPGDPDMEEKLAQTFPYPETPDQKRCIEEVLTDLEDEKPMDRLLCGDSGFGKTEVAIRAAFRTVVSGKQVAILVPTVVLARQHYENFQKRLSPFGVKVALLDSTKTRAERKRIIEGLKKGELDIVIGTHSLLSDDIKFYDLGLIIIDEEQKFGVEQKEKLKKLRVSVNVLSMSATPIPRTLHMALSGMKDLSVINTPPVGRKPIVVYVMEYDPRVVRNAILREVNRGGQVIYVRNRVEELEEVFERLTNLVPEVKIGVAHGRMRKKVMEEIVWDFYKGKLDVLVCTTIIESGVDIPNANTLIVEDSHRYGLAQLYQLRGRVGRSEKRAFAYFLYPKHALKKSLERLKIIKETIGPGSSFEIAMKDMELRGIGSIFGFEQHGNMNSIGFKLYSEILENSIKKAKGEREETEKPLIDTEIEGIPGRFVIPETYVENPIERMRLYRRMAMTTSVKELEDLLNEIKDRFGTPPSEVYSLFDYFKLRILGWLKGVKKIVFEDKEVILILKEGLDHLNLKGKYIYNKEKKAVVLYSTNDPLTTALEILEE